MIIWTRSKCAYRGQTPSRRFALLACGARAETSGAPGRGRGKDLTMSDGVHFGVMVPQIKRSWAETKRAAEAFEEYL